MGEPRYITDLARELRAEHTRAEEVLWTFLRNRQLYGAKFRRQHPIGRFIADFYCHGTLLVVELEGGIHGSAAQVEYDRVRFESLVQQGYKVLRFENRDVDDDLDQVLRKISEALKQPSAQEPR